MVDMMSAHPKLPMEHKHATRRLARVGTLQRSVQGLTCCNSKTLLHTIVRHHTML